MEGRVTKEEYQKKAKELSNEISFYIQNRDRSIKQRECLQKNVKLKKIRSFGEIENFDSKVVDCMIDTIYIYVADRIEVKWAFQDLFVEEAENGYGI